jgi:hypothetical protein
LSDLSHSALKHTQNWSVLLCKGTDLTSVAKCRIVGTFRLYEKGILDWPRHLLEKLSLYYFILAAGNTNLVIKLYSNQLYDSEKFIQQYLYYSFRKM